MATTGHAAVKGAMLRWARESAGLSLDAAARAIGVTPARLADAEADAGHITVRQLRDAARVYARPMAAFFLPAPPHESAGVHDFRRLPGMPDDSLSPALRRELRRLRRRRAVALELAEELGTPVPDVGIDLSTTVDAEVAATQVRTVLGVTTEVARTWSGPYETLAGWSAAVEARGVLVCQTSDVELTEMRGLSLHERPLPAILLNGKDAPRGRLFTLLHEVAHVALRAGGVCDPLGRGARGADAATETWCNRVAAATLVPLADLRAALGARVAERSESMPEVLLDTLSRRFGASREVIAIRLREIGMVSADAVARLLDTGRATTVARDEGGPVPRHRIVLRNNGRRFTRLVLDALVRDRITWADASDFLESRVKHFGPIADTLDHPIARIAAAFPSAPSDARGG
jgi:Zn-dependent peptidase ImmA (M78 family)/transcriptional regulator with XRE-family HTH domain